MEIDFSAKLETTAKVVKVATKEAIYETN